VFFKLKKKVFDIHYSTFFFGFDRIHYLTYVNNNKIYIDYDNNLKSCYKFCIAHYNQRAEEQQTREESKEIHHST
jgi:hypothetical protein